MSDYNGIGKRKFNRTTNKTFKLILTNFLFKPCHFARLTGDQMDTQGLARGKQTLKDYAACSHRQ